MVRVLRAGLIAVVALLSACGEEKAGDDAGALPDGGPGSDAVVGAGTRVELGTGLTTFRELAPSGEMLDLVHGSQGGWHVDVAVRIHVPAPEGMILAYEGRDPDSGTVITYPSRFELSERRLTREGDHWVRFGDRAIFEIAAPEEVIGRDVEIIVSLERSGAVPLSDRRTIRVVDADGI
jgi:hypothetical protein